MALTRITKGVIKPNENYDTHNINSTGIVTAIGLDVNGNGDISGNLNVGGVLTYEDVTSIDSVGIITARNGIDCNGDIDVDGHTNLDNVSIAGVSTFTGEIDHNSTLTTVKLKVNSTNAQIDLTSGQNSFTRYGAINHYHNNSTSTIHNQIKLAPRNGGTGRIMFYNLGGGSLTEKFRIDGTDGVQTLNDTNLSVAGDTTLTGDLDVDGHTNLDNVSVAGIMTVSTSTQYHGYKLGNNSNIVAELVGLTGSNDTGALALWSGGLKYVQLSAIGNSFLTGGSLGIGTDIPLQRLHVKQGSTTTPAMIEALGAKSHVKFQHNAGNSYTTTIGSKTLGSGNVGLTFDTGYNGAVERMVIDVSGKVGIGTDIPGNILDVQGTTHTKIHVGTTGTGHATGIQINHAKGNAALQEWQLQTDGSADGNLKIRNATSSTDVMFFDADNNNIGVNITAPEALLHVENNNAHSSTYYLNSDAAILVDNKNNSGKAVIKLEHDAALVYGSGSSSFIIADRENERLRITSDGQIGVNNASPDAWHSSYKSIQIYDAAVLYGSADDSFVGLGANHFLNSSGNFKYSNTDFASRLYQVNGGLHFETAPSGSAGDTFSFSEKFRITQDGDITAVDTTSGSTVTRTLKVGASAASGTNSGTIIINNGGQGNASLQFDYENSAARAKIYTYRSTNDIIFDTSGTEAFRIFDGGNIRQQKSSANPNFTLSRNASIGNDNQTIAAIDFASNTAHTVQARLSGKNHGTNNVGGYLVFETRVEGGSLTEKFRLNGDGQTLLTRGTVGGQESIGNVNNTWWKIGTWAGPGVDAAARATITVLGANTHNSGNPAGGETKIYLSITGSAVHASFYSHTDHHQGVIGVAHKYDSSASSCEIWVKYSSGYSSTSSFADVTNGYFTGASVNTGSSSTPSGATLATSKFVVRTSSGTSSDERLHIDSAGRLSAGRNLAGYLAANMSSAANDFIVTAAAGSNGGMSIVNSGANDIGNIFFANGTGENGIGRIQYEHQNNAIVFQANNNERLRIKNDGVVLLPTSGKLSVGPTSPAARFSVGPANGSRVIEIEEYGVIRGYNRNSSAWAQIDFEASSYSFDCGGTERWTITSGGDLVPGANDTYDIGSTSAVVRNLFTGDLHLNNLSKEKGNDVDGTNGSWTIQEGQDDLYIINKLNGKKYRIPLEEVN